MSTLRLCRGVFFFPAANARAWLRWARVRSLRPIRIPVGLVIRRPQLLPDVAATITAVSGPAPKEGKSEHKQGQIEESAGEPLVHNLVAMTPRARGRDGFVGPRFPLGFSIGRCRLRPKHFQGPLDIRPLHLQLDAPICPGVKPIHRCELLVCEEARDPGRLQLDSGQLRLAGRIGPKSKVPNGCQIVIHNPPITISSGGPVQGSDAIRLHRPKRNTTNPARAWIASTRAKPAADHSC